MRLGQVPERTEKDIPNCPDCGMKLMLWNRDKRLKEAIRFEYICPVHKTFHWFRYEPKEPKE